MNTAEKVTIEWDENGAELHVMDEAGDWTVFNIHGIAEQVYDEVKRQIGPWLQERDIAKASYDRGEGPNGEPPGTWEKETFTRQGYSLERYRCVDPEDDWIEMQRAHADHARKQEKENRP